MERAELRPPAASAAPGLRRWLFPAGCAAAAVLGVVAQRHAMRQVLLGFDAYPLLVASRVDSLGDFAGTFTEVMMDGRYPLGTFYRPTHNLVIAATMAVFGAVPAAHHGMTLLTLGAVIALLAAGARRYLSAERTGGWVGPLAAALFFALHPGLSEVTSSLARRVELLATGLILATLLTLPRGATPAAASSPTRFRRWGLTFVLALLACGAKESGVLILPLALVDQLWFGSGRSAGERCRRAAWEVAPVGAAVVLYVVARTLVIGGLGGPESAPISETPNRIVRLLPGMFAGVLAPAGAAGGMPAGWRIGGFAALAAGLALWGIDAAWRGWRVSRATVGLALLGGAWLVFNALFCGLADRFNAWYVVMSVTGASLVLGAVVEAAASGGGCCHAADLAEAGTASTRTGLSLAAAALAVCGAAVATSASPLWKADRRWDEASALQREFLSRVRRQLDAATPGTRVTIRNMPAWLENAGGAARADMSVAILSEYSLAAWAELTYPGRKFRVVAARDTRAAGTPAADEVLVIVHRRRAPRQGGNA